MSSKNLVNAIFDFMSDGEPHTRGEIRQAVGAHYNETTVNSAMKALRNPDFGGFVIEHIKVYGGESKFRLTDRRDTLKGRLMDVMQDGKWHTLAELSELLDTSETLIAAAITGLRRTKEGGYVVETRRLPGMQKCAYRLALGGLPDRFNREELLIALSSAKHHINRLNNERRKVLTRFDNIEKELFIVSNEIVTLENYLSELNQEEAA